MQKVNSVVVTKTDLTVEGGDHFVMVTNAVVRNTDMGPYVKALYDVLLSYAGEKGYCWPSQLVLARDAGMCERKVRDCLVTLKAMGLVSWSRDGRTNKYVVEKLPTLPAKNVDNRQPGTTNRGDRGNPARRTDELYSGFNNKHINKGYKPQTAFNGNQEITAYNYTQYRDKEARTPNYKAMQGNHKPIDFRKFEDGGPFAHLVSR